VTKKHILWFKKINRKGREAGTKGAKKNFELWRLGGKKIKP
jgi:hypothetical protein